MALAHGFLLWDCRHYWDKPAFLPAMMDLRLARARFRTAIAWGGFAHVLG